MAGSSRFSSGASSASSVGGQPVAQRWGAVLSAALVQRPVQVGHAARGRGRATWQQRLRRGQAVAQAVAPTRVRAGLLALRLRLRLVRAEPGRPQQQLP